jgi:hypothetical protein
MHSPAEYATALAHQPEDDQEVARDMAIRAVQAAMDQLYETVPPSFAHLFATDARDEADRKYRMRSRSNG